MLLILLAPAQVADGPIARECPLGGGKKSKQGKSCGSTIRRTSLLTSSYPAGRQRFEAPYEQSWGGPMWTAVRLRCWRNYQKDGTRLQETF